MNDFHALAVTIALAAFASLAIASTQVDGTGQQQPMYAQDHQAEAHGQDGKDKKDAEHSREMERRQESERRQDAERQREMEQRQDAERRQEAERRRETDQRQDAEQRQDAARRRDDSRDNGGEARSTAPGQIRADDLIGQKVFNRNSHNEIGKISGFIMDEDGQISTAIIEYGGFLGFFTKQAVVPWNQFDLSEDHKSVVTNMDRQQMKDATAYVQD